MTESQRIDAIKRILEKRTKADTASPEIARKALIKEGFYDECGELKEEFGGKKKETEKAA